MTIFNRAAFARRPALVVFDLDNTLYDYAAAHKAGLDAAARKANTLFGVNEADFHACYLKSRALVKQRLEGSASSHSRLHYFGALCETLGVGAQPAIALNLDQTYWTAFFDGAEFFPDALEFLDDLRLANVPAALLTDLTTNIQYRKLIRWGIDQSFCAIVTSEEAGRDKPHAASFDLLRAKLRTIPEPVWSIGDSAEKDGRAAKRHLGASTLLRVDRTPKDAPAPEIDLTFSSFKALREFFAELSDRPAQ
ncbi:MAG: HAD family hydrolase [Amphiplicatus sp.]